MGDEWMFLKFWAGVVLGISLGMLACIVLGVIIAVSATVEQAVLIASHKVKKLIHRLTT